MTALFELQLRRHLGTLRVLGFKGREAMNELYRFDVDVAGVAGEPTRSSEEQLRLPAVLRMAVGDGDARCVHGLIARARVLGRNHDADPLYSFRIVPRFSLLKLRRSSRIFQDLTTREIVSSVLGAAGVSQRWRLIGDMPKRPYTVQYDETDYAFVRRLLASDGLFFWFDHPRELGGDDDLTGSGRGEVMVISDSAESYPPIDGSPKLELLGEAEDQHGLERKEHQLRAFRMSSSLASEGVMMRGFDIYKPPIPPTDGVALGGVPQTGRIEAVRTFVRLPGIIYEPQHSREDGTLLSVSAQRFLEAERADARVASGRGACRRLVPGRKFELAHHALPELDGEYVTVSCEHIGWGHGTSPAGVAAYSNRFTCTPADVAQRPRRPARRPRQTLETATVTGPVGQESHTDALGRVKVQFHWDVDGQHDDRSSCWLRVQQAWAGAGFGAQFVPRVGSEVLVGFIAGDPDRPIVTGCVHNGTSPNPWSLPRDNSTTGILTRSTPGPGGTNELSFQDRTGSEEVVLRSARTLSVSAAASGSLTTGSDLLIDTQANRIDLVAGDATATIGGTHSVSIGGGHATAVGGEAKTIVRGAVTNTFERGLTERVLGSETRLVGTGRQTVVGHAAGEPADDLYNVSGSFRVGCAHGLSLSSREAIDLRVGDSRILVHPDRIVIESPDIHLQARNNIALLQGPSYGSSSVVLSGGVSLAGGSVVASSGLGASLVLDADAKLDGALVKLNCGGESAGGAQPLADDTRRGSVRFRVLPDGLPADVSSVTLVVATPSGEVVERECPVGGEISFEGRPNDAFLLVETRVKGQTTLVERVDEEGTEQDG